MKAMYSSRKGRENMVFSQHTYAIFMNFRNLRNTTTILYTRIHPKKQKVPK
jgi:hypothetical protein